MRRGCFRAQESVTNWIAITESNNGTWRKTNNPDDCFERWAKGKRIALKPGNPSDTFQAYYRKEKEKEIENCEITDKAHEAGRNYVDGVPWRTPHINCRCAILPDGMEFDDVSKIKGTCVSMITKKENDNMVSKYEKAAEANELVEEFLRKVKQLKDPARLSLGISVGSKHLDAMDDITLGLEANDDSNAVIERILDLVVQRKCELGEAERKVLKAKAKGLENEKEGELLVMYPGHGGE